MLKYVIIGVIIFLCFKMSTLFGIGAVILTLAYILYTNIPTFYSVKGNKELHEGNNEKALSMYKKAVDTKRASSSIHLTYGILLLRCGRPNDAISVFNSIILYSKAKDDVKYQAKQYRILAYHKIGQAEEAMEEATEIFEKYKNTVSYGLLCYLKLANNHPLDETLSLCEEAYDYNSDDRDIVDNLALAHIRKGNFERAKELADDMLLKFPTFTEAYYHGAVVYKNLGDINKAKELVDAISNNCRRTFLTTVSVEEIEELKNSLN